MNKEILFYIQQTNLLPSQKDLTKYSSKYSTKESPKDSTKRSATFRHKNFILQRETQLTVLNATRGMIF